MLDLHGHSNRNNIFIYGCAAKFWRGGPDAGDPPEPLHEQVLPFLLAQQHDAFSFGGSHFRVQRCKESSGRVVAWRECKVPFSYTVEGSLAGTDIGGRAGRHFAPRDLEAFGADLCRALLAFLRARADPARHAALVTEIQALQPEGEDAGAESNGSNDSSSDDDPA